MKRSIPIVADLALTVWIITVGILYFGGYFFPNSIGAWTGRAAAIYALMLLAAVGALAAKFLAASDQKTRGVSSDRSD